MQDPNRPYVVLAKIKYVEKLKEDPKLAFIENKNISMESYLLEEILRELKKLNRN